ncbi:hypothetical protein ACFSTC_61405 [Nonomuraea ferruginea]
MHDEWSQAVDGRSHAADRLAEAARSGKSCEPVRDLVGTAQEAYAVQEINTRRALDEGRRLVGRKIGMTNVPLREKLGIDQPDYGMLFLRICRIPMGCLSPSRASCSPRSRRRSPS